MNEVTENAEFFKMRVTPYRNILIVGILCIVIGISLLILSPRGESPYIIPFGFILIFMGLIVVPTMLYNIKRSSQTQLKITEQSLQIQGPKTKEPVIFNDITNIVIKNLHLGRGGKVYYISFLNGTQEIGEIQLGFWQNEGVLLEKLVDLPNKYPIRMDEITNSFITSLISKYSR